MHWVEMEDMEMGDWLEAVGYVVGFLLVAWQMMC